MAYSLSIYVFPGLAQETYSTVPVGAINRVDNEGDRDPSNRTDTHT